MSIQNASEFVSHRKYNLSDLLAWAEKTEQPYDAICELRKVPRRMGKVDEDLAVLPAELTFFEKHIALAPYGAVSKAEDLEAARKRGNSRVRTLLQRFIEATAPLNAVTLGRDDWTALIAFVAEREGFKECGAIFPTGKSRSLTSLRARSQVAPQDMTQGEVNRIMKEATSEKRKSIRKAIALLNRLITEFSHGPEIVHLLPPSVFDIPAGSDRARAIAWESLPTALRASAEEIMAAAVAGPQEMMARARARIENGDNPKEVMAELDSQARSKRKVPKNARAAREGYQAAITWLLRAAEAQGRDRDEFSSLQGLYAPEIISAACADQIARSAASDELQDASKTQTLGARLMALRTLAQYGMHCDDLVALTNVYRKLHEQHVIKPGKLTSEKADDVCRLIQQAPHLAANFVNAPRTIAAKAEVQIAAARAAQDENAEARGLRLFATAVAFAVQVSRPVRTSNVIRLRHRSCETTAGNLEWTTPRKHAVLTFKEREVKNGAVITVHLEDDEAKLLAKWMDTYRARFIEIKDLEDSVYIIPGNALPRLQKNESNLPRGCVAPSTFGEIWADGADIIGIDLTPHQARHAIATLILAVEPGNFAKVASVLGDTEETVRKHYGRDSGEAAAREVRRVLKARHPQMFRKMRGAK